MAYVAPPTRNAGDLITAADWNQYVRDNWGSLTGLIAYVNAASALSGWAEFTTARGLFILGLVSGGTLATAVGTPLTNQQNVTHTHTITVTGWGTGGAEESGRPIIGGAVPPPGGTSHASSAPATGTASAGSSGMPYIQLLCIQKS